MASSDDQRVEEQKRMLKELINETNSELDKVEEECEILLELVMRKRLRNIGDVRPNTSRSKKRKAEPTAPSTTPNPANSGVTPKQKKPKAEPSGDSTGKKGGSKKKGDKSGVPVGSISSAELAALMQAELGGKPNTESAADLTSLIDIPIPAPITN